MRHYLLSLLLMATVLSSAQYRYIFVPIDQAVIFDKQRQQLRINPRNDVIATFGLVPATQSELMTFKGGSSQDHIVICIAMAPVIVKRSCPSGEIEYLTIDELYQIAVAHKKQLFVLFKHPDRSRKTLSIIKASFL